MREGSTSDSGSAHEVPALIFSKSSAVSPCACIAHAMSMLSLAYSADGNPAALHVFLWLS